MPCLIDRMLQGITKVTRCKKYVNRQYKLIGLPNHCLHLGAKVLMSPKLWLCVIYQSHKVPILSLLITLTYVTSFDMSTATLESIKYIESIKNNFRSDSHK